MGFIAGDSVLDAAYGYGMVCDVIRNPDETYPVICRFWQNTQPREQWEKNTVPEPRVPEIGGSSHRCREARAASI